MKVEILVLGPLDNNCYILIKDKKCLVIDPATDFEIIKEHIKDYQLCGILVTHHHFDHVGALDALKDYYKVPVIDYHNSTKVSDFDFEIIKTPGHTADSVSFYFPSEEMMFVGDFVFKESIGRTDLETGSNADMQKSLELLKQYNRNIKLYPGHGASTNLEHEKKYNIYFKQSLG